MNLEIQLYLIENPLSFIYAPLNERGETRKFFKIVLQNVYWSEDSTLKQRKKKFYRYYCSN